MGNDVNDDARDDEHKLIAQRRAKLANCTPSTASTPPKCSTPSRAASVSPDG
jgi:hypothetical protein